MRIAVCIKQVPDTESRLRLRADSKWIDEEDLAFVMNESDTFALEEGLRIAERSGGEVVVFSLGPERARESLRKALAMGATRAVHLDDPAFLDGDASTNGKVLARAISREEFGLVLTGSQSADVGYSATGSVIAGHLNWPHAWLVMGVEVEEDAAGVATGVKVTREMEGGLNELLRLRLPAVLEVQAGLNHPRYASLKGIMQAKKKEMASVTPADLGLTPEEVGAPGSRLQIESVSFPPSGAGAQLFEGDPQAAVSALVEKLLQESGVF